MIKTVLDSSFDDFDIISNNNKQALTVIHRRHRQNQRSTPQYHRLYSLCKDRHRVPSPSAIGKKTVTTVLQKAHT